MKNSIVNKSLSTQIYENLRDLIIKGQLRPGDRIIELEVAKEFGVSQAPVREALLKLAEESLVISLRYKGTFVSNVSFYEIDELYSFRLVMEEFAIRKCFEKMKPKDIKTLETFFNEMVRAGKENNLEKLRAADISFHSKIYEIADHYFMSGVWDTLVSKLNRIWYLTSQMYYPNLLEVAAIHEPIIEAIRSRDLNTCIRAFQDHVDYERKQRIHGIVGMH
jgi:DNA-binding GntR family transcriptional regulator